MQNRITEWKLMIWMLLFLMLTSFSLLAKSPSEGMMEVYSGDQDVRILDTPRTIPFKIYASYIDNHSRLHLVAEAQLNSVLPDVGKFLEQQIARNDKGCRERWKAWEGKADTTDSAIYLEVSAKVEKWACERILDTDVKTIIARESGTLRGMFVPVIKNGSLQLLLRDFRIDGMGPIGKAFKVEEKLENSLKEKLNELNQELAENMLPKEMTDLGFQLDNVIIQDRSLSFSVTGPNRLIELISTLNKSLMN